MKIIIWIICLFVGSAIKVLFIDPYFGGALPAIVFYLLIFSSASWLSKNWSKKHPKNQKNNTDDGSFLNNDLSNSASAPSTIGIRHRRTEKY